MDPTAYDPEQTRIAAPISSASASEATRFAANEPGLAAEAEATRIAPAATETAHDSRSFGEPAEGFRVGHRIARPEAEQEFLYEILGVHYGGMGIVYCAYCFDTGSPVALKTLRARFAGDARARQLFTEEGRTWVRLGKHPFIARAGNVRSIDGLPYLVTDWIQGPDGMGNDLRGWLGHPRLTPAVAVEMALQIAQGMQHATARVPGLVHRDLKPANILVDRHGRVKVTDFGLAATDDAGAGTPAYMAPEQWLGGGADARTDIYAYGAIVYEMLTGHRLFAARNADEWRAAHLMRAPAAPRALAAAIPAGIENFVLRCLAKDREQRPRSWDEVVSEMAGWFHELTGQPAVLDFSAFAPTPEEIFQDGWCFFELRAYGDALAAYDRILQIQPENVNAWTNRAAALERLKRRDEALAAVETALKIDPRCAHAWQCKARVLTGLGRHHQAVGAYERLLEIRPQSASAWRDMGFALSLLDRFEAALAAYGRAFEIDPDEWMVSRQAHCLQMLHRYSEAVETIDRWLEAETPSPALMVERADCLAKLERNSEALASCDRALELEPRSTAALRKRGEILLCSKRPGEALEAYRAALEIDPGCERSLESAGKLLMDLGRHEEALQAFERLVEADPKTRSGWALKGEALRKLERDAEALAAYERAVEAAPWNTAAWVDKGDVLRDLQRGEEALTAYERATEEDPEFYPLWTKRVETLRMLGRHAEAVTVYDRMIDQFPEMAPWTEKAEVLMELHRYEEALAAFDREVEVYPNSVAGWKGRGGALMALHREEEAIAAYQTVLQLGPGCEEVRALLEPLLRTMEPPSASAPAAAPGSKAQDRGWLRRLFRARDEGTRE